MKQILALLLFAGSVFCATAQSGKTMTPLQFSDNIVNRIDSIYQLGREWGVLFNKAYTEKNFSILESQRIRMDEFLQKQIASLKAMKVVGKGGNDLHLEAIRFMEYERSLVVLAFKPFEGLKTGYTDEQLQKAVAELKKMAEEETGKLALLQQAQSIYAEKNGFALDAGDF